MNVTSLIELLATVQKSTPATITAQTTSSLLPTFQASLLAAGVAQPNAVPSKSVVEANTEAHTTEEPATKQAPEDKRAPSTVSSSSLQSPVPAQQTTDLKPPPATTTTVTPQPAPWTPSGQTIIPAKPAASAPPTIAEPEIASLAIAVPAQPVSVSHVPASKTVSTTTATTTTIVAKRPAAIVSHVTDLVVPQPLPPQTNVTVPVATAAPNLQPVSVIAAPSAGTTPPLTSATETNPPLTQTTADPIQPIAAPANPEIASFRQVISLGDVETNPVAGLPAAPIPTLATLAPQPIAQPAPAPVAMDPTNQPLQVSPDTAAAQSLVTPLLQPDVLPAAPAKAGAAPAIARAPGSVTNRPTDPTTAATNTTASNKPTVHAAAPPAPTPSDPQSNPQQSDQPQPGSVAHGQTTPQSPVSPANQTVVVTEHAVPNTLVAPPQAPVSVATNTATAPPQAAAPANVSVPVAILHQAPDINSARLIQNVSQSEMRVGLRSSEFGDISIRTSATRDVVSAQISLDHDELARTLVNHLPEMQEKLGGAQPMQIRIDLNGQSAGQPSSQGQQTAGGTANSSSGNSSQQPQTRAGGGSLSAGAELRSAARSVQGYSAGGRLDVNA